MDIDTDIHNMNDVNDFMYKLFDIIDNNISLEK